MIMEALVGERSLTSCQQQLVEENLGLAYLYSRRWSTRSLTTEDLLGAACEALCRASLTWRAGRGSFAKYASVAIANAVQGEAQYLSRLIHIPRRLVRQVRHCACHYDAVAIPPRDELRCVLGRTHLGPRQYLHFRQAWLALGRRGSLREVL